MDAWGINRFDKNIVFKVTGAVHCKPTQATLDAIKAANLAADQSKSVADETDQRAFDKACLDAINERVTLASKISARKFEDLREEERTIVYRNLIKALMTEELYASESIDNPKHPYHSRHVLSELLNAIFDIDKMLYFVAPEWWKPRERAAFTIGGAVVPDTINGSVVNWANDSDHSKYFITEKSEPAVLGSSLGWLLQLDGDDLRNAFLNAPWVKAVIPIRPGKEQAAINWLKNVGVEGSDGLDAEYAASERELNEIRANLKPAPAGQITIDNAIQYLCQKVAKKGNSSSEPDLFPKEEMIEANRVLSTPVERVYEHGFYPIKGGFRAKTEEPFEICSQWIEVLPTDQVVPVEVEYNPMTGRQVRRKEVGNEPQPSE